jgi:hypothetical protein
VIPQENVLTPQARYASCKRHHPTPSHQRQHQEVTPFDSHLTFPHGDGVSPVYGHHIVAKMELFNI